MNRESYSDSAYGFDMQADDMDDAADDVDEILDALIEASDDEDLSERKKRGSRGRGSRGPARRTPVPVASGAAAYRSPTPQGVVSQQQLKEALGRVGEDVRRNAQGIMTLNTQMGRLTSQVKDVATVNGTQSVRLGRLDRQMKLDGAIDFATSFTTVSTATGISLVPNLSQLLRGALKTGMVGGDAKGALSQPLLIGGIAFVLNNPQILGGLLGARQPS